MEELKKGIELINNELLFNMRITAGCDGNGNAAILRLSLVRGDVVATLSPLLGTVVEN